MLRLAAAFRPDVVLLDVGMPGLNGLEAAGHLASLDTSIRVLILSMHSSEEYVLRALRAGCAGYLLKGSAVSELEIAARAAARGHVSESRRVEAAGCGLRTAHGWSERSARRPDTAAAGNPATRGRGPHQQGHRTTAWRELQDGGGAPRTSDGTPRFHDVAGLVRFAIRVGLITPE